MRTRTGLFLFLAFAAAAACSAGGGESSFPPGSGGGGGAKGGAGGTFNPGGSGGSYIDLDASGDSSSCDQHCSNDLHSILDCNNVVVKKCPDDQGCGKGGCVPACDAAKANKSTIGCDYYSVDPDIISEGAGACFAAYIANTWSSPVKLTLERGGQTYDAANFARVPSGSGKNLSYAPLPNGEIPPGEVAILFLARFGSTLVDCPVPPAYTVGDGAIHGTGRGSAFHITSSAPVVAYDIFPYGGGQVAATSATLLLPTTAWGTNYIAVDAFRKSQLVPQAQPSIDIVASEDGTTVTISPVVAIKAGANVEGTGAGVPKEYTLNKGEILQFTQDQELIGSPIQSDKPIALWGAATCLNIDVGSAACDSAHQQIPPVNALGHEYVAVRYRNRFDNKEESPPWRMVGAVDGTVLTYDPAQPSGAPSSLDTSQVAEFRAPGPFVVKSQDKDHPFYMSAHMTGCQEVDPTTADCRGDPEFVNVIPPQQYLASYVFFTDPTYPETNLVLVRSKTKDGFKEVNLDCAGDVQGWQSLDGAGSYEYTRIDLVRGNFQGQNGCDNGRHEIKSDGPFGLTVWGWGSAATGGQFGMPGSGFYSLAVSYAYPAGASVEPINTVVVPPVPK
ncbi:MAG: IgGFc-binding protein [Deltaproteobacteria bacterium]|nr:IgGFc-binding protein [Deltaproteobacteria bacterium]